MEGVEDLVEQIFDIEAEAVEVAACGAGQVRAAASVFVVVAKPGREPVGAAFDQVPRADVSREIRLRFVCTLPHVLRIA